MGGTFFAFRAPFFQLLLSFGHPLSRWLDLQADILQQYPIYQRVYLLSLETCCTFSISSMMNLADFSTLFFGLLLINLVIVSNLSIILSETKLCVVPFVVKLMFLRQFSFFCQVFLFLLKTGRMLSDFVPKQFLRFSITSSLFLSPCSLSTTDYLHITIFTITSTHFCQENLMFTKPLVFRETKIFDLTFFRKN